jgi:hypothetical protein
LAEARTVLALLPEFGIDLGDITQQLEDDGIQKFKEPFDRLMSTLEEKRQEIMQGSKAM